MHPTLWSIQDGSDKERADVEQLPQASVLFEYSLAWKAFSSSMKASGHPILWRCIGDRLFSCIIKDTFTVTSLAVADVEVPAINHQEMNALRHAAGYVL